MNLALKYRPKEFTDVVGQKAVSVILAAMIAKDKLSQVLLFTGPSGVGKTSMARIIAAQLNSEAAEEVHEGRHPAVLEIDAASNGSVEAVRNLKKNLNFYVPGNRVVIIDEAHAMSPEAFAALLNMLEFPPSNVTFILITTESHKIPVTIRHRCDRYAFKKASITDIRERLAYVDNEEQFVISGSLLDLVAQRSEGSYREALMILEQLTTAGIETVDQYNDLQGEVDYGPSLIRSAMDGPSAAINQLESVLRYTNSEEITDRTVEILRDIMILHGGIALDYTGKALDSRIELASKLDTGKILKAMKVMWDLQTKLNAGDPVRGLELAYSLIGEILQGVRPAPTPVVSAPAYAATDKPMSFEDLQRKVRG